MSLVGFISPGPTELIILLVIMLLLFGKRLPGVAKSVGQGILEFKKGVKGEDEPSADVSGGQKQKDTEEVDKAT